MPIFGAPSPFEKLVEKATDEANTSENWGLIIECCDFVNSQQIRPIECLRLIIKRLHHSHPNIAIQAVILLDACVSNCGKKFHVEIASREFEVEARKLFSKGHAKVVEKLKFVLRKWSENEFKSDPQLNYLLSFMDTLKSEGVEFPSLEAPKIQLPKDPNVVISDQEEEDIIKALEASMNDMKVSSTSKYNSSSGPSTSNANSSSGNSLYPSLSDAVVYTDDSNSTSKIYNSNADNKTQKQITAVENIQEPFYARALYDFEAVEENELTFSTGDTILVTDSRDENWWSGTHSRGQGMFPANFVEKFDDKTKDGKSVQFNDQVTVDTYKAEEVKIDEEKIDRLLHLLHEADPTGIKPDSSEMLLLEKECEKMSEFIELELERLDKIQVSLNSADRTVREALKMYL